MERYTAIRERDKILRSIGEEEGLTGTEAARFSLIFDCIAKNHEDADAREWARNFKKNREYVRADDKTIEGCLRPFDGSTQGRQRMREQMEAMRFPEYVIGPRLRDVFGSQRRAGKPSSKPKSKHRCTCKN